MKFWDTIAKMCGLKIDASNWGERPMPIGRAANQGIGGRMDRGYERVDELTGKVRGHAFKVEMRDHSLTATIDGHGIRLVEALSGPIDDRAVRIGLIAVERIRPMRGKSGDVRSPADAITDFARKTWKYESAADKPS